MKHVKNPLGQRLRDLLDLFDNSKIGLVCCFQSVEKLDSNAPARDKTLCRFPDSWSSAKTSHRCQQIVSPSPRPAHERTANVGMFIYDFQPRIPESKSLAKYPAMMFPTVHVDSGGIP